MKKGYRLYQKGAKSGADGFKDYNTATKASGEESKKVTKEKERLRTAIMKIANEALAKATKGWKNIRTLWMQ
jgi:hypothetical protein